MENEKLSENVGRSFGRGLNDIRMIYKMGIIVTIMILIYCFVI